MNRFSDDVPDEFYRRYTDTDSRPLTPTPSCATSAKTRNGQTLSHLSTRRCVTPDILTSEENHEKKQIILDLRRSHSQETLYYASSDINQDSMSLQSRSIKHEIQIEGIIVKDEIEDIPEMEEDDGEHMLDIELINDLGGDPIIDLVGSCINARDDDEEFLSRRGRLRKKKSKSSMSVITFNPNTEIETQVAVLPSHEVEDHDHDITPNLSARSSLIAESNTTCQTPMPTGKSIKKIEEFYNVDKSFFLDETSLKTLRMGLNVEIVECIFDRYRHRTMQEVLRTISPEKLGVESDAVLEMKSSLNLVETDYEKWMHLPRKFSRSGSRFEIPMDLKELFKLKPMNYLSKFVFVEKDIKQLYHRTFVKFLPREKVVGQENENEEMFARSNSDPSKKIEIAADSPFARCLEGENFDLALKELLGFHYDETKVKEVYDLLHLNEAEEPHSFRTFSGICAFAERYLTTLNRREDPRNEIEIADFETLARHFDKIECEDMKTVFNIIQK